MTVDNTHLTTGSSDVPVKPGLLRLYSMRLCPFAQRVHLVLLAKNIPHDIVFINLKAKPEWYVAKNPAGKVPAIDVDGVVLSESLILCDYLDETYKERPLHSSDSLRKAQDRLLIERFATVSSTMYKSYVAPQMELSIFQPALDELDKLEKELVARGTKYFSDNNAPGMLDYMIWPWIERLPVIQILNGDEYEVKRSRYPKVLDWMQVMKSDPNVKKWYVCPEDHAKFIRSHIDADPNANAILMDIIARAEK